MYKFSKKMKAARVEIAMTQKELAHITKIHPALISHFETGIREPSLINLRKIIIALGVESRDLLCI